MTLSTSRSGWTRIRARNGRREVVNDPPLGRLYALVTELGPGNPYVVIDRLDLPDGHYAQARHGRDGTWVVEYRDGSPNRHFQTIAPGPGIVYQVLAGWALELPGWRDRLRWRPMYQ